MFKTNKLKYTFLLWMFCITANAQTNLVQNGSFESYTTCPTLLDQMNYCQNWSSYGQSPDYYNTCSTQFGIAPPTILPGYQFPHSGNAYAGMVTFDVPNGNNYREIIGAKLTTTLIVGTKYYLSFFVNLTGGSYNTTSADKMGLRFSTVPYSKSNPAPINNFAHYYETTIITDTTNWIQLTGSFVADSPYKYIAIGNFFDDAHTDTSSFHPIYNRIAYYIIDDICVSTDSVYANTWTGIKENDYNSSISVFPNPTSDIINIVHPNINLEQIKITDVLGKTVYTTTLNSNALDISFLNNGIYFLEIKSNNSVYSTKILVQK